MIGKKIYSIPKFPLIDYSFLKIYKKNNNEKKIKFL